MCVVMLIIIIIPFRIMVFGKAIHSCSTEKLCPSHPEMTDWDIRRWEAVREIHRHRKSGSSNTITLSVQEKTKVVIE